MKRLMTAVLFVAGLALNPMASSVVHAQSVTKQVEQLSGQAAAAYGEGDFEKAIELFKQAYALQAVPNLLFNIAKVYEKIENWEQAMSYYKEFLKAPDADPQARQVAVDRIDSLQGVVKAEREAREEEERRLAEEERKKREAELAAQQQQQQQQTEEPTGGASAGAWITAGAGVALLVGGGVFGLLASDQETAFDTGETPEDRRAARSKGKTYALVADSMFVGGAIATTIGIILFATSSSGDEAEETAALPIGWVGPGGEAGLGLRLRF